MIAELRTLQVAAAAILALQWGRDQLIAELIAFFLQEIAFARFNGAAIN